MARLTFARKRAEGSLHGEGYLQDVQTALCTSAICFLRQSLYIYWAHGPRMLRMVRFGTFFVQSGAQGRPASEFVSVTRVLYISQLFVQLLPLISLVAYKRSRSGRCWHWPGPHLDESRPGLAEGGLYVQKWGLLSPTSTMHGWLRRTPRMRHETWQL